jgi:hypothetical protein
MGLREIAGVQNPTVRHARATGWLGWKMRIEGRNGCPDFWFFKNEQLLIMEFKSPTGKLSEQQVLRIRDLERAGFNVHVISDADSGRALLDSFEDELL